MPSDRTGVRERVREYMRDGYAPNPADVEALLAALDAAEADTKRLDWLEANSTAYSSAIEMDHNASLAGLIGESLRSRIDQTRATPTETPDAMR
jgi:AcrR family transcriptional regulator